MRRFATTIAVVLLLGTSVRSFAQEADSPAPSKGAAAKKAPPPRITDPAVLAILDSKPKNLADELESAILLAQLGQPDLARQRLKKLIDAKLPPEALAGLANALGTPDIMRLANDQTLAPEAAALAGAILAADAQIARDPQRLQALVVQLSGADLIKRQDATLGLLRAGGAAVLPLIDVLMDPAKKASHPSARAMILRLKSDAVGPLAALTHDLTRQALSVQLLGELHAESALARLMALFANRNSTPEVRTAAQQAITAIAGRAPDDAEAIRYLQYEVKQQLERSRLIDSLDPYGSERPQAADWEWSPDRQELVQASKGTADIARSRAADAARALATLNPTGETRLLVLTGLLQDAKHQAGLDRPLTPQEIEFLKPFGAEAFQELLGYALKQGYEAAAAGAAEMLGRIGSPALLMTQVGTPSTLALAARDGNRRVRFAAIEAICRLRPKSPFPGSSAVSDALKFFAHTSGARRALVVDPRSGAASKIAGLLAGLGYEADIATNGRDAYAMAIASPDYELALIHVAIERSRADFLLRQLRADSRTEQLPIGLIALPLHTESADRLAEGVPMTHAFAEPQNADDVRFIVERLLSKPGCLPVPFEVRQQQAAWAIGQLAGFAEKPVPWLDARSISRSIENSLYTKGMTPRMVDFLADAGTATGQRELVQLAAREALPRATRELAALAFARSVAKHGTLLSSDQILELYDRYNANAGKNKDTHKVMLIVLEAMEAKGGEQ
jgi:CheY-like chemotaxis protein